MAEAFIEAKNLRKTYHVGKIEVEALRGISFSVQRGEFVSVVGPSGSGKSTLFYLLGGLTRADGGSVVLDGDDLATLSDAERTRLMDPLIKPFGGYTVSPDIQPVARGLVRAQPSVSVVHETMPAHRPAREDAGRRAA